MNEVKAKKYITYAMFSMGWILLYDIIVLFNQMQDLGDIIYIAYSYIGAELLSIICLVVLFEINNVLKKANNPEKYKESENWFYEKIEEYKNV